MELHDLLPRWLADRIAALTGVNNAIDALERLCSMNCVELALTLTQAMLNISREGMDVAPINAKVIACYVIREDKVVYIIFILENDLVCITFQEFEQESYEEETMHVRKWYTIRPCTKKEYEVVSMILEVKTDQNVEVKIPLP